MADPIMPGSSGPGTAAANAVAPDPLTAQILAKHTAGEKLTPQEYGKLGAWKAKLAGFIPGRPKKPGAAPVPAAPAVPGPVSAPAQAPPGVPGPAPVDPRLVQRTTESILQTCENVARRKVAIEARKAGANAQTLARFDAAVSLPQGAKDLMVEHSALVAESMGLDPRLYPLGAFLTGLSLWAGNVWMAIAELKEMQAPPPSPAARPAAPGANQAPAPAAAAQVVIPTPSTPPGAPPNVTANAPS